MALRLLRTKLSNQVLPCHDLFKWLRPLHASPKTAASAISSVEDSFASAARAKRMSYHQASCSRPRSPWKVMPDTSLIHGKRNFASSPSITENVLKMNSFKKSSSAPGDEKRPKVEAVERCECDYCSSQRDIDKFLHCFRVFGIWMLCIGIFHHVWTVRENLQLRHKFMALDEDDH